MGFGIGKLWRGLVLRENDKNTIKGNPFKSKKILKKIFGEHKRVQRIDVQFDESSSALEPVSKDIQNTASICTGDVEDGPESTGTQLASTQGTSTATISPHGIDHKIEGQELVTTDANSSLVEVKTTTSVGQTHLMDRSHEGQDIVTTNANGSHVDDKTATGVGQTLLIDRPHPLRQAFTAHDSILPQQLPVRILRIKSAVRLDHRQTFYGSTSTNTDEAHQSDAVSTVPDDSLEHSTSQNGESYPGLHSPEETPEIEIPPPEPENNFVEQPELSPSRVNDEEENSDSPNTKSSSDREWDLLFMTIQQTHEIELTGLREDLEALKAKHQQDLDAANSTKLVLQKRIKKLVEKAAKHDSEARNATVGQAAPTSRYNSADDLRKENTRLCDLVSSLSSKNNESNVVLESAQRKAELLESQLAQSRESNRVVAKHYQTVCKEAAFYMERMHAFNYALEQEPGKYTDVNREIKIRDERYFDLRAEMFSYCAETKKILADRRKDVEAARAEAAELRTKLEERDTDVEYLKASRAEFKHQSEEVYEMLGGQIAPSTLFESMNEYFQLVLKDNNILRANIEDQMLRISSDKDSMKLLSSENQSLKQQSSLDRQTQASLEHKICGLDIEIGRLEFKVDCDLEEHQRGIQGKDSVIASLHAINDERSREVEALIRGADTGFRRLIRGKNFEIARLKADLSDRTAENRALAQTVQARDEEGVTTIVTYLAEMESDDLRLQLRTATEELTKLQRQLQESEAGAEAGAEEGEEEDGEEAGAEDGEEAGA
ncbi:hypothetical protein MMC29_001477 [Sticta canariensis]|nr:hypothetical protein [Sticta canariensis]